MLPAVRGGALQPSAGASVDLVSVVDANYCPHLGVLLKSIAETNPHVAMSIHVIHSDVSEPLQQRVAVCAPAIRIVWHRIEDDADVKFQTLPHVSRATYFRLRLDDLLSQDIERVLYLDVDVVVNGDLKPLWNTVLGGKLCAAVVDPGARPDVFAQRYGLIGNGSYFNAGVVLMDLKAIRKAGILAQALALLADPGVDYKWADQDVLNIALWNKWLPLDPKWNFQRGFLYDAFSAWRAAASDPTSLPIIFHYTEAQKPWRRSEWHPYAWLYVKNLLLTPFKSEILRAGGIDLIVRYRWWLRSLIRTRLIFQPNSWYFLKLIGKGSYAVPAPALTALRDTKVGSMKLGDNA